MAEKKEAKTKEAKESKESKEAKEVMAIKETEVLLETKTPTPRVDGNFVYVGKKGAMAYVLAVVTQFGMGAKDVTIKARGKSISRAVDVAEIVRNRDTSIKLEGIGISTEDVVTMDGRPLKVSSIEIVLTK